MTGVIALDPEVGIVNPGDHVTVSVELQRPVSLDIGMTFAVREGNRTVGAGTITAVS